MRTVSKEQAPIEVVQPISRVFIANRGEIARRILHTSQLYGPNGVGAVVAFSEADANSLPVREARILEQTDDRFATAYLGLEAPSLSYDNVQSVIDSAKAYGCDVVHPGYGFLAERPEAAHAIREAGLRFIGPPTEIIAQVGDKEKAREIAKRLDIPLLPGTSTLSSYEEALKAARKIEFPVMVKAQNAGGGSGNRVATTEDELAAAFPALSAQFEEVYIEKYLDHAQHIEVQIAAGKNGDVIILGERDCSAQRKFQKVIEESPAPTLDPKVRQRMHRDAIKMAKHVKYQGLGTWEFLYDSKTNKHYFLE
ncbi:MAG: biotin carboxylase N-terminal domain-containing protein, partial [bacterium]|nr:biotin carboxylase N-terminal domain-containing protein [bacterium]